MNEFRKNNGSTAADVPKEALEKIKYAIHTAKVVKTGQIRQKRQKIAKIAVTSFAVLIFAVPNISAEAADAMPDIPILRQICEVVTFRDYHYSSERFQADVTIPEIVDKNGTLESADAAETAKKSDSARINQKINETAQELIDDFKKEAEKDEGGYSSLYVNYEILHTTDEYFTLKLITYQGAGSGFEQNYYYTIDAATGKELSLADLFPAGSDYVTPISQNIKKQMREKMRDSSSGALYWVDIPKDDPVYEWSFKKIKANQSFYVNADGELVIAFGEGDVAPMYMGTQEFVIPKSVTDNIK